MTYAARCSAVAAQMERDGWPRLHSPNEDTNWGGDSYARLYRNELIWRLVRGEGDPPPDLRGTAYEISQIFARKKGEPNVNR